MPSYTPAMAPQTPNNIVVQTRLRLMPQARGPRPQQYGIVAALQPKAEGCTSRRQSNGPGQPQAPATAQNRQGRPRARHKQKRQAATISVVAACQWYASGREAVASRLKEFYMSGLLRPCGNGLGRLLLSSCGLALFVAEVEHVLRLACMRSYSSLEPTMSFSNSRRPVPAGMR